VNTTILPFGITKALACRDFTTTVCQLYRPRKPAASALAHLDLPPLARFDLDAVVATRDRG